MRRRLRSTLGAAGCHRMKTAEVVKVEDRCQRVDSRLVARAADIRREDRRSNRLAEVDRCRRIGRLGRAAILEVRRNCSWHLEDRRGSPPQVPWGVGARRDNHCLGSLKNISN